MKTHLSESDFKNPEEIRKSQREAILACYETIEKASSEDVDDFKHHKLMAAYHSIQADEFNNEALELSSGIDSSLHQEVKNKKSEAARHESVAAEHRSRAKSLYDEKKHGDIKSTVPSKLDALAYGNKVSKGIDKNKVNKEEDFK